MEKVKNDTLNTDWKEYAKKDDTTIVVTINDRARFLPSFDCENCPLRTNLTPRNFMLRELGIYKSATIFNKRTELTLNTHDKSVP